ncbi:nucleoporin protein Ndc1-Nup-domain-containing protein [Mycena belliarum]|uniref:Nucleoporin protein Ndc1-Nup-domain-containing protein n=1 Tax=Mycena belliarum TaxID=1033014 RepID=A0AAD6UJH8_9AGAR|nr:nucleoporin protein Ndc1-Nup-domain-containing protein [Mycena belliae]
MASPAQRPSLPSAPTPIRAITTPLRSSAPPPIPAASELYAPLAKAVLRRRLTARIFPYTFLLCATASTLWLTWIGHLSATRAGGAAVVMWGGGVLPVLVVRKAYLTVTRTSAPSPSLLFQKSLAPPLRRRTLNALQAHLISALSVLALHAILDPTLPVFIRSRKHPYTPHPVLVLLALSQVTLAALCVLRASLRDAWVFPFRRPSLAPTSGAVMAPLLLPLAALPMALFALFIVLPVLRRVPIVSLPLRVLRTPHLSVLRSLGRAWALGAQTVALWEAAGAVWAWGVGEPLRTTPSIRALVSGISVAATPAPMPSASSSGSAFSSAFSTPSSLSRSAFLAPPPAAANPSPPPEVSLYTHLAYAELLALASADADSADARRAREGAFEADAWARLVREVLILLGREYGVLKARGGPVAPSPLPAAAPSTPSAVVVTGVVRPPPPTTPLLKQNIFRTSGKASPGARMSAALASGGAFEEVVAPALEAIPVPSISMPSLPASLEWRAYVPTAVLQAPETVRRAMEVVASPAMPRVWTQKRMGREVVGWVPRREVVVDAIEALTYLTCASLAEDRLGVVQRDIPRVLEALVEFLGAVEGAVESLRADKHGDGQGRAERAEQEHDLAEARAVLGDVGDALKEGLARITRTFGDKLRAFRFAPRVAGRLQGFLDYCA